MDSLYDQDLVLWSEEQARALRAAAGAGWNVPIDWENVAEEIETLGRSERHALRSHIATVVEHLLRLKASAAIDPVRGWHDTIRRTRRKINVHLTESPSLGREVAGMVADELVAARELVRATLEDYGEQPRVDIETLAYTEDQVLSDWLPERT